jgi:SPOR domain
MRKTLTALIFLLPFGLFAQQKADSTRGYVIHKDTRLDLLIRKQSELNKEVYLENRKTGPGFRVQVINTNDRNKAVAVKTKLMQEFADQKTYLIYQSPYFKIQIGNFKSKKDATTLRDQIAKFYPDNLIVVPATIELKTEKEDNTGN